MWLWFRLASAVVGHFPDFREWLLVMFAQLSQTGIPRLFVLLWTLWGARNHHFHQGTVTYDVEIQGFVIQEIFVSCTPRDVVTFPVVRLWKPPPQGEIKVNFDGSFLLELGRGGVRHIIVEGDSRSTISCVRSPLEDYSYDRSIISSIKAHAQSFGSCVFQHVGRSGNAVADAFARERLASGSNKD
ncbi:hypothetical protein F3Y22_tig00110895pilonHSYRG00217 [Hibiscus syriacus]|uniref:RNase H type-1 domain-containing protein n=1 Tax=Hibiscus syriacus TaxID=106335 RepID=A0A6A2ZHE8_HIBSY|nr:hypothetical protein F3Y22_tig00110895pilonHSYRG00217 [Hibiscus syriacus]